MKSKRERDREIKVIIHLEHEYNKKRGKEKTIHIFHIAAIVKLIL